MEVLEKARALIARPSVTPDDAGCLGLIASWLVPLGFSIERIDAGGVSNLWARRDPRWQTRRSPDLLRRPHRRGADRTVGSMDLAALRADHT
jgi:acetylornithine deacetylase/succinyl-diaminopimelate desuccinylase-like protein